MGSLLIRGSIALTLIVFGLITVFLRKRVALRRPTDAMASGCCSETRPVGFWAIWDTVVIGSLMVVAGVAYLVVAIVDELLAFVHG